MTRFWKHVVVTVIFAGQLVAVWALNRKGPGEGDLGAEAALKKYGFYLRESSKQAGLDFVHQGPANIDARLEHIKPIIASMGASVAVADFDRDGWQDIYVVTSREGAKNRLYKNNRDGTFTDVAEAMGLADLNREGTGVCQGAVWGDFDNDGFEDLLVYKWGKPELFRNVGGKKFERLTEGAGLPAWVNANSAIWLDFDRDGRLDLFITAYWREDVNLWKLGGTAIMPESFKYAENGGRKYLLRNKGDGTFEDVTPRWLIDRPRWTLAAAAADLCGSGYPDIVMANDYGVAQYLCNKGGRFEEVGQATGIGEKPRSGMNVTFADILNTGQLAIYITNITESGILVQYNNLWVPEPKRPGEDFPRYTDQAQQLKVDNGGWAWGTQFGDLNNDGYLDLYLTNGNISSDSSENYWYDYGKIAGANKAIIEDAKNWPAMHGRSLGGNQTKCVWWNRGGEFIDVAKAVGVSDSYDGRSVVMADLFNRGVLDVLVANQNGPLLLYKNTVAPGRDWLQVELEGTKSNRSAIGAMVRVYWTMEGEERVQEQVQVVSGGNGYASQNMRRLHYGLGRGAKVEKIVVQWPSGAKQTVPAPKTNVVHRIKETQS